MQRPELPRLLFVVGVIVAMTLAVGIVNGYLSSNPAGVGRTRSKEQRDRELAKVEAILDREDRETTVAVESFFRDLVRQEDERTKLLQERASSLLGTASVVLTIILAGLGVLSPQVLSLLKSRDKAVLFCLAYLVMLIIGTSLFWTWKGFTVRNDFVGPNPEALLREMGRDHADLDNFYVFGTLEGYVVYQVNYGANSSKANALAMATGNLFFGLLAFAIFYLILMTRINAVSGPLRDAEKGIDTYDSREKAG